jgi:hypothetical protein
MATATDTRKRKADDDDTSTTSSAASSESTSTAAAVTTGATVESSPSVDIPNNDKRAKLDNADSNNGTTTSSSPRAVSEVASPRAAVATAVTKSNVTLSTSIGAVINSLDDISGPKRGLCAAVASDRGKKHYQQDTSIIVDDLRDVAPSLQRVNDTYSYYGVYDGHGGDNTSQWLAERLHLHFAKILSDILVPSATSSPTAATATTTRALPDSKKPEEGKMMATRHLFAQCN